MVTTKQTKNKDGKISYYVDGELTTQSKYIDAWAKNKGYKNISQYGKANGWKHKQPKTNDKFRFKDEFNVCPDDVQPIPGFPNYYATRDGKIWCNSVTRKRWILISQQTQKTGYKVCQLFVEGKKYIKYIHKLIALAYLGECLENHEVNHVNRDKTNNHMDNLEYLPKDVHRRMKRGPYQKTRLRQIL